MFICGQSTNNSLFNLLEERDFPFKIMIYSSNGDIQINDFATQNIVIEFLFHLDTAFDLK